MIKCCQLLMIVALLLGCKRSEPDETFTKGSARIGASDAVFEMASYVAYEYNRIYPQAFVTFERHSTLPLLDSLLSQRVDEVFIDRVVTSAESASFAQRQLKLFTYPVAHYPTYLLVPESLAIDAIDSTNLKRVLEGVVTNWKEIGGPNVAITPYAPLEGVGSWFSLLNFYGELDSVAAVICSSATRMLELSADDPGALLIFSHKPADAKGFKKLRWAQGELRIPANAKTILESPRWPFMTTYTYVTTRMKSDVAAGFLTFLVSNDGQKMVMKEGYRPASIPVRVIQLKSPPEEELEAKVDTLSQARP